ncbi:sensor histidine kinase [Actinomyces slackii]|uniref:Sensor histidine kinase desK n=1 Tax=Actinomyces slackii TaxID=52774 RepID=A0A3S4SSY8_9ACTO|nr:ATP-binding protein [Actinomyces slackii]VEG74319.1 Sensor histidine kinase desK [Actinomyces slackii]
MSPLEPVIPTTPQPEATAGPAPSRGGVALGGGLGPSAGTAGQGPPAIAEDVGTLMRLMSSPRVRAALEWVEPPRWTGRILVWTLACLNLVLLWRTSQAFGLFFLVFPLLWIAHGTFRAGVRATLLFGAGIAVVGWIGHDADWLLTALISTGFSLFMGVWILRVVVTRAQAVRALADKQEAMAALVAVQEELAAAERAAGRAAEHERWAREVHDTLAQGFVSVITLAQVAQAGLAASGAADAAGAEPRPKGCQAAQERLAQIEEIARENLSEARALVAGQAPSALHDAGLGAALTRLAGQQHRHGLKVAMDTSLPEDLPVTSQVVVLRTVQEALSNVVRHSGATRARVSAQAEAGEIIISVRDEGRGTRSAPEGTGLSGMRARLESLGGSLTVDPLHAPDAQGRTGTILEARMPL